MKKKDKGAASQPRPRGTQNGDIEVEVKIRCEDVERLLASGLLVELDEDRHLEDNYVFQLPDGKLRKGQYLRVRHIGDGEGAGRRRAGVLTYKGKPKRVAGSDGGKHKGKKVREEIETTVGQPPKLLKILKRLGIGRSFRYQKYRTIYRVTLSDSRSLLAMFDETPIGNFLELEGDPAIIEEVAAELGYTHADFLAESYVEMHMARCSNRGEGPSDMLFEAAKVRQAKKHARRKRRSGEARDGVAKGERVADEVAVTSEAVPPRTTAKPKKKKASEFERAGGAAASFEGGRKASKAVSKTASKPARKAKAKPSSGSTSQPQSAKRGNGDGAVPSERATFRAADEVTQAASEPPATQARAATT